MTTLIFIETRFAIPYFQQMTLRSKISKIIHTLFQKMEWSVNYFRVKCEIF
jgi:hypothetical protein